MGMNKLAIIDGYLFKAALLCYILGVSAVLLPKRRQLFAHYFSMTMGIIGSAAIMLLSISYFHRQDFSLLKLTFIGSNLYAVDSWSAFFLMITGFGGVITSLYSVGYSLNYVGKRIRVLAGLWNLFLLSMVMVLTGRSAFTFLFAWEIMAIVSFLLVNHESEHKQTWQAAYQYLVMTHIGTGAIMIAFFIVGSASAGLGFHELNNSVLSGFNRDAAFLAAFLGFALKAGLVPLHVWLPNAHPAAPSHVSAIMSGVMLKIAVYGFGRFIFGFLGPVEFSWGLAVFIVGLISAFFGALYAQMENDVKRILAYSSVENMGIIFAALGLGMLLLTRQHYMPAILAFTAALIHSLNHSVMKTLMFMAAGAVSHAVGDKSLEKMGGLAKRMPWTAFAALCASLSLASLPLTGGFVGEWLLLNAIVLMPQNDGGSQIRILAAFGIIMLGLSGALGFGCFVRFFGVGFLGRPRSHRAENAHESPFPMIAAMLCGVFMVFLAGIAAQPIVAIVQEVAVRNALPAVAVGEGCLALWTDASGLLAYEPAILFVVLAVVGLLLWLVAFRGLKTRQSTTTWNCGTCPQLKQQYSGTGFSKPVRRAFDFLLKPRREVVFLQKEHKYFGRNMLFTLTIPDRFTEKLYIPLQHRLVKIASLLRRIQTGSVRMYVAYVLAAMVGVLIWGAL